MRILYLCSDKEFGGGQRYFCSIMEALGEDNRDFGEKYIVGCKIPSAVQDYFIGSFVYTISFDIRSKFDFWRMIKFARTGNWEMLYDVILLGDGAAWMTGVFLRIFAGHKNLVPIVHMTHIGLEQKEHYGYIERKLAKWFDRAWARFARFIIVSNDKNADILRSEGVNPDKIRVIKNGININKVTENIVKLKSSRATRVGTVARLGAGKDFKTLFDAFTLIVERDKNYEFLICGVGPLRSELEKYVKSKGIEKYVKFLGWVENVYEFIANLDVFVFSGISDGIPYTILEAMALRTPVVATDNGAVSEAIKLRAGFRVEKNNSVMMAEKIMEMADLDFKIKIFICQFAYNYCKNNFSIEIMREKLLNLLNEMEIRNEF